MKTERVTLTLCYAGIFALYYLVTLAVASLPNIAELRSSGLLVPVICLFEFAVLYPVWRFYCARRDDIPPGRLPLRTTLLFLAGLALLTVAGSLLQQPESWLEQQAQQSRASMLIMLFSAVILAPIFEEILFRGFLLQGFLLWAPKSPLACATLTSVIFAALHTQYVHLQTLALLSLFSLLLCYARLTSRGLKLPILLHMINNFLALLPALSAIFLTG